MAGDAANINRWWRVVGGVLLNVCLGSLYAWSVFVLPLEKEFGWTRTETSMTFTLAIFVFALTVIPSGKLQDKFGPGPSSYLGALLLSAGFFAASFTSSLLWLYLTLGLIVGIGNGFGYATPIPVGAKWFPDKRGLVVGVMVAGYGAGSALIGPVAGSLIGSFGWRSALQILGGVFLIVSFIGAALLKNPPAGWAPAAAKIGTGEERKAPAPGRDSPPLEMIRMGRFYKMWFSYALGASAGLMLISQLVPFARSVIPNITAQESELAITVGAVGNASGRILSGWMSDALGRVPTLMLMMLISALVCPLIANSSHLLLFYVLVFAAYWCYGTLLSVFPSMTADSFGLRNLGANYGLVFTAWGVAGILGPRLGGRIFDSYGNYSVAFYAAAPLSLIAAGLVWWAGRTARRQEPEPSYASQPR